jgi:hypothetical protein
MLRPVVVLLFACSVALTAPNSAQSNSSIQYTGHSRVDESAALNPNTQMRWMTIGMGAMAGMMLVAIPMTWGAVAAGAAGGYVVQLWYDNAGNSR